MAIRRWLSFPLAARSWFTVTQIQCSKKYIDPSLYTMLKKYIELSISSSTSSLCGYVYFSQQQNEWPNIFNMVGIPEVCGIFLCQREILKRLLWCDLGWGGLSAWGAQTCSLCWKQILSWSVQKSQAWASLGVLEGDLQSWNRSNLVISLQCRSKYCSGEPGAISGHF